MRPVKGGQVYGTLGGFSTIAVDEGRDLAVTTTSAGARRSLVAGIWDTI